MEFFQLLLYTISGVVALYIGTRTISSAFFNAKLSFHKKVLESIGNGNQEKKEECYGE